MPTLIYHITHIKNLPSILQAGGLLSNSQLQRSELTYADISYERIQDRRARKIVPCAAGGVLHDYIPFYFAARSPMLFTINKGNVPGCPEGQTPILHLVTTAELIAEQGLPFAFTDGHAVMNYSIFYDSLNDLSNVDWNVMNARMWTDTIDDSDRSRRRQAEFLVHDFLPWNLIIGIGVINEQIQRQTEQILQDMNQTTRVRVRPRWYY